MKHFMLDIETMGTDPIGDDVLEIAFIELNVVEGYFNPGRVYTRKLFTAQKPKDEWIAINHKELLKQCHKVPMISAEKVRAEILDFFKLSGEIGRAKLVGLNLMSLDIPFMLAKGFLKKDDFHYRIFEMRGTINTACMALDMDEKQLYSAAEGVYPEIQLPEGKKHEALYDCYKQLKVLNGIIRLLRRDYHHASHL